jgi:hypothetical protein
MDDGTRSDSPLGSQRAESADSPAYPRRGRLRGNSPFVNAREVAPDAERRDVFVFVTAAPRAKLQMMRRHVSARAHGARAPEHVAPINAEVLGQLAGLGAPLAPERGKPDATEVFA